MSIFEKVWTAFLNTVETSQSPGLSTCLNLPIANLYFTNTKGERFWFIFCILTSSHVTRHSVEVENSNKFLSSEIAQVYQFGVQFSTDYYLIFWTRLHRCHIASVMDNIIDINHRIYFNFPPASGSKLLWQLAEPNIDSKSTGELKKLFFLNKKISIISLLSGYADIKRILSIYGYLDDVLDDWYYIIREDGKRKVAIPSQHLSGEVGGISLKDVKEGSKCNGVTRIRAVTSCVIDRNFDWRDWELRIFFSPFRTKNSWTKLGQN